MKQKNIPKTGELSDEQKEALYLEAKKLAERDSVGSYERAVFLLSKIPGWKDSDRISAAYRQRIFVLQA